MFTHWSHLAWALCARFERVVMPDSPPGPTPNNCVAGPEGRRIATNNKKIRGEQ